MKAFWDARYSRDQYAYGTEANLFFAQELKKITPGKLLLPAEGEGRNAVFAALNGWNVTAFDLSEQAKLKALKLAEKNKTIIHYDVFPLEQMNYAEESFDAIGLIYAHFHSGKRADYHQALSKLLKTGGHVFIEAFRMEHPVYQERYPHIGGPSDSALLYSEEILQKDFPDFRIKLLQATEAELNEGDCHCGVGAVVRMVAQKK